MKKIKYFVIILMCCLFLLVPVNADMGPKPTVSIDFKGLEGKQYYVTLLSKTNSMGPFSMIEDINDIDQTSEDYNILLKFFGYEDEYYFLGEYTFSDCSSSHHYEWIYYPPDDFKILIYLVNEDAFICSDAYSRYAFDSYFNVEVSNNVMNVSKNGMSDGIKMIDRIVMTIIIEIIIAFIFKIKDIKSLIIISMVNLATQMLLNLILQYYIFSYILVLLEIAVIIIEALIYKITLKNINLKKIIQYTVIANTASFLMGLLLVHVLPNIF